MYSKFNINRPCNNNEKLSRFLSKIRRFIIIIFLILARQMAASEYVTNHFMAWFRACFSYFPLFFVYAYV